MTEKTGAVKRQSEAGGRMKYPKPAERRRRAHRAADSFARDRLTPVEVRQRTFMAWIDGYESCMRDVRKAAKGESV